MGCDLCHKQYASKAKLLQHHRKKHQDQAAPSTSRGSQAARPAKVLYIDPPSPNLPRQMIEDEDEEDEDQPGEMGMDWEGGKRIPYRPVTLPFTHRHAVQTIVKAQTECLSSFYQDLPGLRARFRGKVD